MEPADWKPRSYWMITLPAVVLASLGTLIALAMAEPWCLIIVGEMTGLAWLISYCRHFLYHRLICLGGDRDVIGAAVSVSEPEFPNFDWDNDYSINLLLQNTPFNVTQEEAAVSQPYGQLVAAQSVVTSPPVSQTTAGHYSKDKCGPPDNRSATLHAEFEGAGIYDLLQISQAMLGFATAALLACLFLPYPLNLILGFGLAALALLGWLIGAILSKTVREGEPSDVNPEIGTIQTNSPDENGLCRGADILYVQGSWVFDPLHEGWNEIHPIKVCTKVGTWEGEWSVMPPDVILRARQAFEAAQSEETRANQALPENQWQVHPDLDGCVPPVVIE